MARKLTISIADEVYDGLYAKVGPRKIGKFLEGLARPHVVDDEAALEAGYAALAADEDDAREAALWDSISGETIKDDDEAR